jgi:hypothetical protein
MKTPLSDPLDDFHVRDMPWQSPRQNMNVMATLFQARALLKQNTLGSSYNIDRRNVCNKQDI